MLLFKSKSSKSRNFNLRTLLREAKLGKSRSLLPQRGAICRYATHETISLKLDIELLMLSTIALVITCKNILQRNSHYYEYFSWCPQFLLLHCCSRGPATRCLLAMHSGKYEQFLAHYKILILYNFWAQKVDCFEFFAPFLVNFGAKFFTHF